MRQWHIVDEDERVAVEVGLGRRRRWQQQVLLEGGRLQGDQGFGLKGIGAVPLVGD